MRLRTCPSCKNIVGTESICCPRCGISVRRFYLKRLFLLAMTALLVVWLLRRLEVLAVF